jgi:hypothetical protein
VSGAKQLYVDRIWTLTLLAWALLLDGKTGEACKLMGAAGALMEVVGADAAATRAFDIQQVIGQVEALLDDPARKRLWEEGRALDAYKMTGFALRSAQG